MWMIAGFAVGMFFGCFLFWTSLKDYDELWNEHQRLLRELMLTRWQLSQGRTVAQGRAGISSNHEPSRN